MSNETTQAKPPYRSLADYSQEEVSERVSAIIRAAVALYERDHGCHLGMPRLSGIRDNGSGHAPCMWCILNCGTSTWDISTADLDALSESLIKEMAARKESRNAN